MNESKEIKFIDLFAGVGGFHKGLTQANERFEPKQLSRQELQTRTNSNSTKPTKRKQPNFSCIWANEWDKHAASIYQKQFPKTPFNEGDIRLVKANNIPKADLLVGGFPCQPFSLAGKRKGLEETRGTLFYEILRIARDKRIKFLLLENVKGLLSAQEGKAFGTILSSLDELGYCLQWQVLNSKNFGVPQNRERVFIIGCLGKKRFKQIFPLGQNVQEINGNGPVVRTLTGGGHSGGLHSQSTGIISKTIRTGGRGSLTKKHHWDMIELTQGQSQGARVYNPEGISQTISSGGGGLGAKTGLYLMAYPSSQRSWGIEHRIKEGEANTLTNSQQSNKSMNFVKDHKRIRRLTPTECERLQGFPNGWTEGLSDTQRYKCMGNAVTVNVIEAIGKKILETGAM